MKKILITGANGQLGREINLALKDNPSFKVLNTDKIAEVLEETEHILNLDITDKKQTTSLINEFMPDIIINCAAFTAVDRCESEQELAYDINVKGALHLAVCANTVNAVLVHISTDYVFDGKATLPYTEDSPANPQSVYGRTKYEGEQLVVAHCKKYFIIRTAWLYGDGKNFVATMLRLAQKEKQVRVVNDQWGAPTSTKELVRMILILMETEDYGIYHGTCEGSTNWHEFAKEIFRLAGYEISVIPISTAEYKTAAVRPAYSVLENKRFNQLHEERLADWKTALEDYIRSR